MNYSYVILFYRGIFIENTYSYNEQSKKVDRPPSTSSGLADFIMSLNLAEFIMSSHLADFIMSSYLAEFIMSLNL